MELRQARAGDRDLCPQAIVNHDCIDEKRAAEQDRMYLLSRGQTYAGETSVLDDFELRNLNVCEEHVVNAFTAGACNPGGIDYRQCEFCREGSVDTAFEGTGIHERIAGRNATDAGIGITSGAPTCRIRNGAS